MKQLEVKIHDLLIEALFMVPVGADRALNPFFTRDMFIGCKCCCRRYTVLRVHIVHHTFNYKRSPYPHSNNKTCLQANCPPSSA